LKSPAFVPVRVNPVALTLSGAEVKLNSVEFIVGLVTPIAM
jgi:hypothetical protein